MPSFSLRPATAADQTAIRRMVIRAWLNPHHLDWRHFVLAVDDAGEMVGCGQIRPHATGWAELASLATLPAWQGQGVATAVVGRLLQTYTAAHPTAPLWLLCAHPLALFYPRFGFAAVEELPPYMASIQRIRHLTRTLHRWGVMPRHMVVMRRAGQ